MHNNVNEYMRSGTVTKHVRQRVLRGTGSSHELVRGNDKDLTWVQQRLFLEVVQLLTDVTVGVIVQVVADVIEKNSTN